MKKAFDQNVSRAKPRLRLGAVPPAEVEVAEADPTSSEALEAEVQARVERARQPRSTAAQLFEQALEVPITQVAEAKAPSSETRRERLKERLKAVRENPRPEPLPPTSAEAGVLAVERIAGLQQELGKVKALNLALTQDLEAARRQAERATEEARLRIDEARRLAEEMQGRMKLLTDLERELAALEGERDEALLSLQESRGAIEAAAQEALGLRQEIATRDQSLQDSLAEEERLAAELERSQEEGQGLRRALDALRNERDTLAHQVSDLSAERTELLEARKALESVHRALSQAAAR
jgi:hypothetical protein